MIYEKKNVESYFRNAYVAHLEFAIRNITSYVYIYIREEYNKKLGEQDIRDNKKRQESKKEKEKRKKREEIPCKEEGSNGGNVKWLLEGMMKEAQKENLSFHESRMLARWKLVSGVNGRLVRDRSCYKRIEDS